MFGRHFQDWELGTVMQVMEKKKKKHGAHAQGESARIRESSKRNLYIMRIKPWSLQKKFVAPMPLPKKFVAPMPLQ